MGCEGGRGPSPERRRGPGPPACWGLAGAGRGRIRRAVLRRPRYICPRSPGPPHSPSSGHVRSRSLPALPRHGLRLRLRPRSPPWLCSRDRSVPPARLRAHRACALHSRLLSSAEAAAASPFRRHGVSNRSSLRLQLPFPPFRTSRPSRPGLRGGGGGEGRVRDHGRAGAEEGTRASARSRACALGPMVRKGAFLQRMLALKTAPVRLRRRTSPQRGFYLFCRNESVRAPLLMRISAPEPVFPCEGLAVSRCTCALAPRRAEA